MRKLLSKTAGATFNEERPNLTLCVRKDCIEFIYKGNPQVQLPRLEKCCPKLFAAFLNENPDGIKHIRLGNKKNGEMDGFAISLPGSPDKTLLECITTEVLNAVEKLIDTNLKFYHELYKNPPFLAWKDDLKELWN